MLYCGGQWQHLPLLFPVHRSIVQSSDDLLDYRVRSYRPDRFRFNCHWLYWNANSSHRSYHDPVYSYLPQTIFIYLRTFYVIRTFVTALSWCFGRSSIRTLSVRPLSPLERSTLFCKLFQLGRLSYRVWKGQAFENVVRIMFTHHSFDVHSLCLY